MTTYKLLPILERLQACPPAREWVTENKYKTFKEAWGNIPEEENWHYWVIHQLRLEGFDAAQDIETISWRVYTRAKSGRKWAAGRRYYLTPAVCKAVEEMLIQYAHDKGCAEEVPDEVEVAADT